MSNKKPKTKSPKAEAAAKPKQENRNWKPARFVANAATKLIWQWFVRPLAMQAQMAVEERTFDMNERISIALGDQYRRVAFVKATEAFRLPATRWQEGSRPNWLRDATIPERTVKAGDALVLRTDERTPDLFEVEFAERVFVVTEREFQEIESKVRVVV